jgi:integrase
MARKELPPRLKEFDGTWYVVFSEGGRSQRQSLRTADLSIAQSRFQGWLDARQKFAQAQKSPTFELAFKLYMEQHAERRTTSPETIAFIGTQLNWYFGEMRLEDITSKDILDYTAKRLKGVRTPETTKRAVKPGTVRKELTIMRAVFNFMVKRVEPKELRCDTRHLCYIEIPSKPAPRQRVLSEVELARLRELCTPADEPARIDRLHRYLWLLMETGARAGALRDLKWDQVDFKNGFIVLNPWGREQTKKRRPTLPISQTLLPILERASRQRINDYVLDHPGQIRKSFDRFMEKHQFDSVTAHTFRHTFATHLAQNGVSMVEISQLLGDQLTTVEKNYLHYSPEYLRSAINSLSLRRMSGLEVEPQVLPTAPDSALYLRSTTQ